MEGRRRKIQRQEGCKSQTGRESEKRRQRQLGRRSNDPAPDRQRRRPRQTGRVHPVAEVIRHSDFRALRLKRSFFRDKANGWQPISPLD